jgi:hypothetical protein
MARYVMILRGATSLLGGLEGVGPENQDFWALKWHERSEYHLGPKKSTPTSAPRNDVAPLKIITYRAIKTTRYINSYSQWTSHVAKLGNPR